MSSRGNTGMEGSDASVRNGKKTLPSNNRGGTRTTYIRSALMALLLSSVAIVVLRANDGTSRAKIFPTVAIGGTGWGSSGVGTIEGGLIYTDPLSSVGPQVIGPRLTVEAGYGRPGWIVGLKAGCELSALIFSFRASAGAYTDFNGNGMISILPEAGFGWLGMVTFTLGCQYPGRPYRRRPPIIRTPESDLQHRHRRRIPEMIYDGHPIPARQWIGCRIRADLCNSER